MRLAFAFPTLAAAVEFFSLPMVAIADLNRRAVHVFVDPVRDVARIAAIRTAATDRGAVEEGAS